MKSIEKKSWPEHFEKVLSGEKKVDLRTADFEISAGDMLVLKEFDPKTKQYTGREIAKMAGNITKLQNFFGMYKAEDLEKFGALIIELKDEEK